MAYVVLIAFATANVYGLTKYRYTIIGWQVSCTFQDQFLDVLYIQVPWGKKAVIVHSMKQIGLMFGGH